MSASTQNGGGIDHWLAEEMKLWHVLLIFIGMALAAIAFAHGVGFVMGMDYSAVDDFATRMVGGAGLFGGILTGWHARRYKEAGKLD